MRVGTKWPGTSGGHAHSRSTDDGDGFGLDLADDPRDETADYQTWLSGQPDDVRETALEGVLADAKLALGDDEVAAAEAMGDDEASLALANEIATMKARDHREYVRLLASLPSEDRANMREIERKYGV